MSLDPSAGFLVPWPWDLGCQVTFWPWPPQPSVLDSEIKKLQFSRWSGRSCFRDRQPRLVHLRVLWCSLWLRLFSKVCRPPFWVISSVPGGDIAAPSPHDNSFISSISLPTLPLNWVELLRSWDKLPHQLLNDWKFHHSPSRLWNLRLQQQGTSSHMHASVTYIHPSPRANGNNEPLLLGLVRINKDMYWQRPYVRTYIHTVQQSRAKQRRAEQSTV